MYIRTQEKKICSHFHAINLSTSISIVCTSPSPQANEPVNKLTPEKSGNPNQNLQNNVVPLQLWHVYQWTKQ